jgi:hypothetical protein
MKMLPGAKIDYVSGNNIKLKKGEAALIIREEDFSLLIPRQEPGAIANEASLTTAMLAFVLVNKELFELANEAFEKELHKNDDKPDRPIHFCTESGHGYASAACGAALSPYDGWGKPDEGPEAAGYTFDSARVTCQRCRAEERGPGDDDSKIH